MTKRKQYRVKYERIDGTMGFVETSGDNLTEEQAKIRAIDYLNAIGYPFKKIQEVYEINH